MTKAKIEFPNLPKVHADYWATQPKEVVPTAPGMTRFNLACFAFDVITGYMFDQVTGLNALAVSAQARDLPEIEMAIREQICRENQLRGVKGLAS